MQCSRSITFNRARPFTSELSPAVRRCRPAMRRSLCITHAQGGATHEQLLEVAQCAAKAATQVRFRCTQRAALCGATEVSSHVPHGLHMIQTQSATCHCAAARHPHTMTVFSPSSVRV